MSRWDEPMSPVRPMRFDQAQLDRVRVAVRNAFRLGLGPTVSMSADVEWHAEQMALEVSAEVLAERLPPEQIETSDTFEWSYPDGWWQMWLHEHRMWPVVRWWVGRHPVRLRLEKRMVTVVTDLERWRTYPQARVPLPEDAWGRPVLTSMTHSRVRWKDVPGPNEGGMKL